MQILRIDQGQKRCRQDNPDGDDGADGEEARDLYCAYLEFHGFGAEAAEDGPSGIALALARNPDVIVLEPPELREAVIRQLKGALT